MDVAALFVAIVAFLVSSGNAYRIGRLEDKQRN